MGRTVRIPEMLGRRAATSDAVHLVGWPHHHRVPLVASLARKDCGRQAVTAMLLLATLLAGCGASASQPVAELDEGQRVGEPTGGAWGVPEEACPQVVACTAGSAIERLEATDDGSPHPIIDPGPCRDEDACAEGFLVGETFHAVSCGPVRPELVTDEVVARGPWAGDVREVRVIAGVDPAVLVAIDIPGGECAEGDAVLSDFRMVFVGRHDPTRAQEATCAATVDEHLARNGC